MFLVGDTPDVRARKIRRWLKEDPQVGLLVAAAYFEWIVGRAIVGLGRRTNREIHLDLDTIRRFDGYKDLWQDETRHRPGFQTLATVVTDWPAVRKAFTARNRLIHGREYHPRRPTEAHAETLLAAAGEIIVYCDTHNVDINRRLAVRRRTPTAP